MCLNIYILGLIIGLIIICICSKELFTRFRENYSSQNKENIKKEILGPSWASQKNEILKKIALENNVVQNKEITDDKLEQNEELSELRADTSLEKQRMAIEAKRESDYMKRQDVKTLKGPRS